MHFSEIFRQNFKVVKISINIGMLPLHCIFDPSKFWLTEQTPYALIARGA